MVKAKKSLGQHFLIDKNISSKIVDSIAPTNNLVIEIGPGTGVLTRQLVRDHNLFKAVEIDREAIEYLKSEMPHADNWLIEGDFLKIDLGQFNTNITIVGNFPYYISSQIFFKILDFTEKVDEIVCMVQKEVAERLASPNGTKQYGLLSVLLQTFYNIEYLFTVHEHCFQPAPRVKSAVIRLKRNQRKDIGCSKALFFKVVKGIFNQRRKTIRNSLKSIFILLDDNRFLQKRPEQLSVDDFLELTAAIEKQTS